MYKDFAINDEQITKGNVMYVTIPKIEVEKFAMIVLTLTNLKSSMKSTNILEISTVYETNNIIVTFDSDDIKANEKVLKYAIDINTMDLEYEISVMGDIEVITIYGSDLEENGIVEDGFEIYLKGEY